MTTTIRSTNNMNNVYPVNDGYVDRHVRRMHTLTLGTILLLSLAELGLSAFLTQRFHSRHNAYSHQETVRVHYLLFAAAWTALTVPFYLAAFRKRPTGFRFTGVHSHLGYLLITWAIWLAAAALLTHLFGGGPSCRSGFNPINYCRHLSALEGIAWTLFSLFTLAALMTHFRGLAASRRGDGYGGALIGNVHGTGYSDSNMVGPSSAVAAHTATMGPGSTAVHHYPANDNVSAGGNRGHSGDGSGEGLVGEHVAQRSV